MPEHELERKVLHTAAHSPTILLGEGRLKPFFGRGRNFSFFVRRTTLKNHFFKNKIYNFPISAAVGGGETAPQPQWLRP